MRCYCGVRFFFFQAEDGIRDLVRSRGLGDVYKRQAFYVIMAATPFGVIALYVASLVLGQEEARQVLMAVSYTHLTLPTSDLV